MLSGVRFTYTGEISVGLDMATVYLEARFTGLLSVFLDRKSTLL